MSAQPQFSLATVLRVRELAEEQEEQALTRILREMESLRSALARTEAELLQAAAAREQVFAEKALPAMHLHTSYGAAHELRVRSGLLRQEIANCENLRTQQVSRYEEAYRKREVLRSLRDEARNNWAAAQGKKEQDAADEAFLARLIRNGREREANRAKSAG